MTSQLPLPLVLAPHHRFSTFVGGSANRALLAHLAALGGERRSEMLWIWGETAAGKTHLLQAVCAARPERRAMYVGLREYVDREPDILEGLEQLDLIALDDVGAVLGNAGWNTALFALINAVQAEAACLVCAASAPPAALKFKLPDLASRVSAAAVYEVRPLADSDRILALQRHAAARGLELSADAAQYLLRRVPRDMRGLCDWLAALDTASLAAQRKLTVPLIRQTLADRG
jgi:DnaA family protein